MTPDDAAPGEQAPPPETSLPVSRTVPRRGIGAGVFLVFFAVYLLGMSRERPWADANPMYEVAENLVYTQTVAVSVRWPADAAPGREGKNYAFNPLLTSLVHVPGAALRVGLATLWPRRSDGKTPDPGAIVSALAWPWACHLGPAALGALVCWLFFLLCRQHGLSARQASLGTLLLGLGSVVWVYARYPYSEILQAACFTGFVLAVLRGVDAPGRSSGLLIGLFAGLLVNSKVVFAAALPGPVLVLAWTLRSRPRALLRAFLWSGAPLVPAAALILYYNWLRFGGALNSGYNAYAGEYFGRGRMAVGLWGYLLSPGKSIFLYTPALLLALVGLRRFVRRFGTSAAVIASAGIPVVLVYAKYAFWHGDYAWGPRYLTFLVPVALLPAVLVIGDMLADGRRKLAIAVFALALGTGAFVQTLGNAFYWDHYIRIAMEAKSRWLGAPNRGGAITPYRDSFAGCDGCFEDLYQLHWVPQFQPILGHWWLLKHVPFQDDFKVAEPDAPWHPDTKLGLPVTEMYRRARIDWWGLDYAEHKGAAAALLATLTSLLAAGAALWIRALRRVRPGGTI